MIKINITKGLREERAKPRAGVRSRLSDASYLAEAYAEHVLFRVAERGQLYNDGGARRSFSFRAAGRSFLVSSGYAKDATGIAKTSWKNAAEFHRAAGAKAGTFNVNGGMWDGLTVTRSGRGARVQFGKSSDGADSKLVTKTRNVRRGGQVVGTKEVTKAAKVPNRVKARKILQNTGVNVLAMPDSERRELGEVVSEALKIKFERTLNVGFSTDRGRSRSRLGRRARQLMTRGS